MNRKFNSFCKKVCSAVLISCALTAGLFSQEIEGTPAGKGNPKYVFVFVGDGMSYPQIQSSAYYIGKDASGIVNDVKNSSNPSDSPKGGLLSFMKFPVAGSAQTYDATSFAPDSASTATSIFTGNKTHSSSINVDISKKIKYRTIAGSFGLASTAPLTALMAGLILPGNTKRQKKDWN